MRSVTNTYLNAANDYGREWSNKVTITDGNVAENYTSCDIQIDEVFSESDNLSMGKAFAKKLTLKIKEPKRTLIYNLSRIFVVSQLKVSGSLVPITMGHFWASKVSTSDDYATLDIEAYDFMAKLDEDYTPQSTITTDTDLLADIVSQYSITLESGTAALGESITLVDGTVREQLAWLAGMQGKNAIFNSAGELSFRWYAETSAAKWQDFPVAWQDITGTWASFVDNYRYTITRTEQKQGGASLDEGTFTIASITSGTSENVLTVGSGKGISFECPYMTQTLLTAIGNSVLSLSYKTGEVKTFGNPALEAGDIVSVVDKTNTKLKFIISNISWNLTGGCSSTITSVGNADAEIEFDNVSPSEKKLNKVKSTLQSVVAQFSNLINSVVGYFTITEQNGVPTGWEIKDNLTTPVNMIKCSLGGIGISSDGGQTYETAITGEGIVADTITSGTLTLGGLNDDLILEIYNTSGTKIGEWNKNGITATAGNIGGWTVDSNGLTNAAVRINSDGSSTIYTVADLLIIKNYILSKGDSNYSHWALSGTMLTHYDFNGDGQVTSQDYITLKNLIGLDPG